MSFTVSSPLIVDWIKRGLEWRYFWRPVMRPFTVPAGAHVQIPSEGYTFSAPEGSLISIAAVFDHPACGLRLECEPELDTGELFTINTMAFLAGLVNQPYGISATVPPQTPPGVYNIANVKEWSFEEWMRLYVFNSDSIDHRCLGYGYTVALLREAREAEKES